MARITALVLVIGGALAAAPAAAQLGNIFGDNPPRPPADVPNGPFPQQPPPPQYPDQSQPPYPSQAAPAYPAAPVYHAAPSSPTAIETEPLPPPPGAAVTPVPRAHQASPQPTAVPTMPALAAPPPANGSAANAHSPAPAAAEAPPDDTVVERPTAHIENRRAVFSGLDKITGRTITFDAAIGETVQFGALQVTPRACYTRPPTEATNTDAFVEVDEVTLQGEIKRIFTGWMFASSPGLYAVEHPIYDVWLTDCASPIQTSLAEPPAPAPEPAAKPRHPVSAPRERVSPPSPEPLD
jgi:hypothetical protein